jgi:hypothetical protein
MSNHWVLRVARPTDRLEALARMYSEGLGLIRLGSFEDHAGFDGVILGHPGAGYHLEFTSSREAPAAGAPSPEHLLVFYVPDPAEYSGRCGSLLEAGFIEVAADNPYWNVNGRTFADIDGYRVVLCPVRGQPGD